MPNAFSSFIGHPAAVVAVGALGACGAAHIHGRHLKSALTAFRPAAEVFSAGVGAGVRNMGLVAVDIAPRLHPWVARR